jgi:copper resistance protein B
MKKLLLLLLAASPMASSGEESTSHMHPTQSVTAAVPVVSEKQKHAEQHHMDPPIDNEAVDSLSTQPALDPIDAEYFPYKLDGMGAGSFGLVLIDQFEYRVTDGDDLLRWDVEGWYGGDFNRFWFKTEGEQALSGPSTGSAEIHGYFSRLIAPYWDAQAGLRYDQSWDPKKNRSRVFAAIGVEGLAPYRFEFTPTIFVSEDGDVSARLTATKDIRFTQHLVAQGRFETEIAAQDVPEFGVGDGFNYVELGLRLRYEIRRELAPYLGVNWERKTGETARYGQEMGEDRETLSFIAGIRAWF